MEIKLKPAACEASSGACEIVTGEPSGYVIFGASGDCTHRKLLPVVFSLFMIKKVPVTKMCLAPLRMELDYRETFGAKMEEDYSTLILDCILGNQMLYWRKDGVETSWKLLTPVLQEWEAARLVEKEKRLAKYASGGWGPEEAKRFIAQEGRAWLVS